jgi:hypothetical protein
MSDFKVVITKRFTTENALHIEGKIDGEKFHIYDSGWGVEFIGDSFSDKQIDAIIEKDNNYLRKVRNKTSL